MSETKSQLSLRGRDEGNKTELCMHERRGEPGKESLTNLRQGSVGERWREQCLFGNCSSFEGSHSAFRIILAAMRRLPQIERVGCSFLDSPSDSFCSVGNWKPLEPVPSATDSSVDW